MAERPTRPTEVAIGGFMDAVVHLSRYETVEDHRSLARALKRQSQGLIALANGLRATYILLEEVRDQLNRQKL